MVLQNTGRHTIRDNTTETKFPMKIPVTPHPFASNQMFAATLTADLKNCMTVTRNDHFWARNVVTNCCSTAVIHMVVSNITIAGVGSVTPVRR
jgi:NADH:ubiquinone oxidoreductase subunit B-like Fe-S oxidoreductase